MLNGASVTLVDQHDVAYGATAYSSRLIHGGLRYLEYGEFDLVRESLGERARLLRLAPQFIHPLQLFIPTANRWGGFAAAAGKFVGLKHMAAKGKGGRGLMLVRAGLAMYDAYARDPSLPRHQIFRSGSPDAVPVDRRQFPWVAAYYDAQVRFPERLLLAMLADALEIAKARGGQFRLLNYHRARPDGHQIVIEPSSSGSPSGVNDLASTLSVSPAALINATGAWIDRTWQQFPAPPPRLMGGTKGSHCFTFHAGLRKALAGRGLYAEAADGRPVFVTPLGNTTLIGTTDEPFDGDPATAVAREDEVQYLLSAVNHIMPQVGLTRADVAFSYCGVRPLPYVHAASPAAITRRHRIERHQAAWPCFSLVGGKLTTCRSLAEEAATLVLADLGMSATANTRERPIPGGEDYPAGDQALHAAWVELAARFRVTAPAAQAIWWLYGTRSATVLAAAQAECGDAGESSSTGGSISAIVPDHDLPVALVRWMIRHEWVHTLDDLVERRLMLLYDQRITRRTLAALAQLLVDEGRLSASHVDGAVAATVARLSQHFGKSVDNG